jgi:hypothetical protein
MSTEPPIPRQRTRRVVESDEDDVACVDNLNATSTDADEVPQSEDGSTDKEAEAAYQRTKSLGDADREVSKLVDFFCDIIVLNLNRQLVNADPRTNAQRMSALSSKELMDVSMKAMEE